MRQFIGKLLSILSGVIFVGMGLVVVLALLGNEAALWFGGWFLLFFGLPLLALALIAGGVGKYLRQPKPIVPPPPRGAEANRRTVSDVPSPKKRMLGKGLIWLSFLLFGLVVIEAFFVVQTLAANDLFSQSAGQLAIVGALSLLDYKLVLAVAVLLIGKSLSVHKVAPVA